MDFLFCCNCTRWAKNIQSFPAALVLGWRESGASAYGHEIDTRMKQALLILLGCVLLFVGMGLFRRQPPPPPGKTVIEFWTYNGGGSAARSIRFWKDVGAGFESQNPDVQVRVVADINQGNFLAMLTTRLLGGNPPDVIVCDDGVIAALNQDNLLTPLDEFIQADKVYRQADFPASMVNDGYVGNTCYSIPWYGGYGCMVYRTDLFAQAGVAPPRTWQDLLAVSKALQSKLGMKYPLAIEPAGAFWMWAWMWQNGGDVLDPDCRKVTIDTPEVIGAVQFVHDLVHVHKVVNPSLTAGTPVADLWSTGQAAMMIDGSWVFGLLDENYPALKGKWEVLPLPAGKRRFSFYGGQHMAIPKASRHADIAWRFMAYATRPDVQQHWSDITGSPPSNLRTFDLPDFKQQHPHLVRMKEAMLSGRNNPLVPFMGELWYGRFANKVLDKVMPEAAADVPSIVGAASLDLQATVDEYWRTHRHFVQGRRRHE